MTINKAYTRDELREGMVIQLRKNGKSSSFTLRTDKDVGEVRLILLDFLNKSPKV